MGKAKVTISDVARAAGVSSSAVSYALNDKPGVSSETVKRCCESLKRWGGSRTALPRHYPMRTHGLSVWC